MTLTTLNLSSNLYSALIANKDISRDLQLFEALDIIEDEHKDELENIVACYGPDTTIGALLLMAKNEEPKPFTLKDLVSWLKFWA